MIQTTKQIGNNSSLSGSSLNDSEGSPLQYLALKLKSLPLHGSGSLVLNNPMVCKFLVIDDREDTRNDGSKHRILALADQSRPALTHTLNYAPKGDDLKQLPELGKAVDGELEMAVRALKWNNFQLCMELSLATILKVSGMKPLAAVKP